MQAPTTPSPQPLRNRPTGALLSICLAGLLSGCGSHLAEVSSSSVADAAFTDASTFSRNYGITPQESCEAARRALLSQAYLIIQASDSSISARKNFQRSREQHYEVEFHVTCVPNTGGNSTVFASAVQQLYGLRKTNSSASVGVGILGSLSVPIKSEDDSLVKIGSVTLTKPTLYQQFFDLVENHIVSLEEITKPAVLGRMPAEHTAPSAAPAAAGTVLGPDESAQPLPD